MTEATCRFTYTAGLLVRGSIRRNIKMLGWKHNLDVTFEEEKGILESDVRVVATGSKTNVIAFDVAMRAVAKEADRDS